MQLSVKCGQCARTKQVNAITLRWHFTPLPRTFSLWFPVHIYFRFICKEWGEGGTRFFTRCELRLIVVSKMICLHPPHSCRRRRRCLLRMLCLHTKCAAVSDTSYRTPPPPGSAYHPVSPFRNCSSWRMIEFLALDADKCLPAMTDSQWQPGAAAATPTYCSNI